MSTTSSTTKAKPENQNITRTKSLGRKPKPSEDGSDQKPEKPLPNYLKPTISSRPDPVKFLKKNNNSLDDNQKLLRRRSFDRPPSSLTSPSTSSQRRKSLNVSPSLSRDRPAVPREKSVTSLRSSSFHGSRSVPKGGNTTAKSPHVVPKKSSSSLESTKEGSATREASEKESTLDSASLSSAQEDEEESLKVENDVDVEEPKEEEVNKEVELDVVQADQENKSVEEDCIDVVSKEVEREEEEEEEKENMTKEDKTEEKIEETKEQENNQDNKEEDKKKIDHEDETPKKVDESVEETTEEEVKEEEKEKVKEEEEESREGKKREVVKAPSAYNEVIASKMQENPRRNKVLALAGAFQTVIDYETAASK